MRSKGPFRKQRGCRGKGGAGWGDHGRGRKLRRLTPRTPTPRTPDEHRTEHRAEHSAEAGLLGTGGVAMGTVLLNRTPTVHRRGEGESLGGATVTQYRPSTVLKSPSESPGFESPVRLGDPVLLSPPGLPGELRLGRCLPDPSRPACLTERHQEAPHACSVLLPRPARPEPWGGGASFGVGAGRVCGAGPEDLLQSRAPFSVLTPAHQTLSPGCCSGCVLGPLRSPPPSCKHFVLSLGLLGPHLGESLLLTS